MNINEQEKYQNGNTKQDEHLTVTMGSPLGLFSPTIPTINPSMNEMSNSIQQPQSSSIELNQSNVNTQQQTNQSDMDFNWFITDTNAPNAQTQSIVNVSQPTLHPDFLLFDSLSTSIETKKPLESVVNHNSEAVNGAESFDLLSFSPVATESKDKNSFSTTMENNSTSVFDTTEDLFNFSNISETTTEHQSYEVKHESTNTFAADEWDNFKMGVNTNEIQKEKNEVESDNVLSIDQSQTTKESTENVLNLSNEVATDAFAADEWDDFKMGVDGIHTEENKTQSEKFISMDQSYITNESTENTLSSTNERPTDTFAAGEWHDFKMGVNTIEIDTEENKVQSEDVISLDHSYTNNESTENKLISTYDNMNGEDHLVDAQAFEISNVDTNTFSKKKSEIINEDATPLQVDSTDATSSFNAFSKSNPPINNITDNWEIENTNFESGESQSKVPAEVQNKFDFDDDDEFGDFGSFTASAPIANSAPSIYTDGHDTTVDEFADFASPSTYTIVTRQHHHTDISQFLLAAFPLASSVEEDPNLTDLYNTDEAHEVKNAIYIAEYEQNNESAIENTFFTTLKNYHNETLTVTESPPSPKTLNFLKVVMQEKLELTAKHDDFFSRNDSRLESSKHTREFYNRALEGNDIHEVRLAIDDLQKELFQHAHADMIMQIAQQAALSAKAQIAEKMKTQQHSSSGRNTLLNTTRNLLSRSSNNTNGSNSAPTSTTSSGSSALMHMITPPGSKRTKSSVHSTFNGGDSAVTSSASSVDTNDQADSHAENEIGESGDETSSETSTGEPLGRDDPGISAKTNRSVNVSGSNNSQSSHSGGLMKKFLSFSVSGGRSSLGGSSKSSSSNTRYVNLRRTDAAGDNIRTMEVNVNALSGGFDELKWKCAVFLYNMEEVAHVAPSQISITQFPGTQKLTVSGKSDKGVLTKLFKPGTIWTVDIGRRNLQTGK